METRTITVYEFEELSDGAKEKALQKAREAATMHEWYDFIFDDAKTLGKLMGIEISNIFFSGFWSQGDGACFEGTYSYAKDAPKAVKSHAPKDEELVRIARKLQELQRPSFYRLTASVKHSGHYYHRFCTTFEIENTEGHDLPEGVYDGVVEALRDFMAWIYKMLEQECEFLTKDETLIQNIKDNEYRFHADGSLA